MAAAHFGQIQEFDGKKEEWTEYWERFQCYCDANEIANEGKKRAVFLASIGSATYKLLSNLKAPEKPKEKSLKDINDLLKKHYDPAPSEIVQRFKFHTRCRKLDESISTFMAELRAIADHCNFGQSLNVMSRDRLVCGVNDKVIQKRLLSETDITLKNIEKVALAMESAANNARTMGGGEPPKQESVHKTDKSYIKKPARSTCYRCGSKDHTAASCRFKDAKCHGCGKIGHVKRACRTIKSRTHKKQEGAQERPDIKHIEFSEESEEEAPEYDILAIRSKGRANPLMVSVQIEGVDVSMEVDTGASVSLVSEETYKKFWPNKTLQKSAIVLRTYSKEVLKIPGSLTVTVKYKKQVHSLPLLVVAGAGPSLFGRDWLEKVKLDWYNLYNIESQHPLDKVLEDHKLLFEEGLGTLRGYEASFQIDQSANPKYCKPRSVPYAIRPLVEKELEHLEKEGIIEPVAFADWAAPIVPVVKPDKKSVRICGDFKMTINQASRLDRYPIPKVEDLLASLAGGQSFTKLDLNQAYLQVKLKEESHKYVVVDTHKGLFQYIRLPYGVASAPGIFQRVMENVLQGLPHTVVYIDDILVTGRNEEHIESQPST